MENTYPVRNVPSILYTNPPIMSIHSADTHRSTEIFEHPDPVSGFDPHAPPKNAYDLRKRKPGVSKTVAFLPISPDSNTFGTELVAVPGWNMSKPDAETRFHAPTYSVIQEKHIPPLVKSAKGKDTDDYIFQLYVGSLSVIGLFALFRIIQKG